MGMFPHRLFYAAKECFKVVEKATIHPGSPPLSGFLLAQCEVVLHDVEWFGRNLSRGSFPCGMLLEFRDELFLHAENHIGIDVPRILLKQMGNQRLITRRGNIEVNVRW